LQAKEEAMDAQTELKKAVDIITEVAEWPCLGHHVAKLPGLKSARVADHLNPTNLSCCSILAFRKFRNKKQWGGFRTQFPPVPRPVCDTFLIFGVVQVGDRQLGTMPQPRPESNSGGHLGWRFLITRQREKSTRFAQHFDGRSLGNKGPQLLL